MDRPGTHVILWGFQIPLPQYIHVLQLYVFLIHSGYQPLSNILDTLLGYHLCEYNINSLFVHVMHKIYYLFPSAGELGVVFLTSKLHLEAFKTFYWVGSSWTCSCVWGSRRTWCPQIILRSLTRWTYLLECQRWGMSQGHQKFPHLFLCVHQRRGWWSRLPGKCLMRMRLL